MAQDISLKGIGDQFKDLGHKLRRHMSIIFVVVVLGALVYSVFSVNLILGMPSDEAYRMQKEAESFSTRFDDATIEKIDGLKDRQEAGDIQLPGGRINPFAE
jgi:hypothetical protein